MKVLQVIPSVSPVHGGPSRAIVDIEQSLARRGIDVTTVATNDDGDTRTLSVQCGEPIATPCSTRWYFRRNTLFFKLSFGLGRWLKDNITEYDVVHAHGLFSFTPVVAAFLASRAGVPYVLRPLGALARYGLTQHHPILKRVSFTMIERPLLESANAVHFTSYTEQAEAEALGLRCNSVMIPLGIDVSNAAHTKRAENTNGGAFSLLFLSRIHPKKNLEGLLQALKLVRTKNINVTLNIAGDGNPNYLAALRSLVHDLAIDNCVKWLGHIDGQQKNNAMSVASAFVLPSHSENFGIAVAEALAAGLPCLVSRGVAISDEVEKAGAGIVSGTMPAEIATAIERLLEDRSAMATRSAAARALACNKFSMDTMGARLEALYRDLAFERGGRAALAS